MSPLKVTAAAVFCGSRVLLDWKCSYSSNPLMDFNGNQKSGVILIEVWFDKDAELFKPVKDETVLGKSRNGALGSREL